LIGGVNIGATTTTAWALGNVAILARHRRLTFDYSNLEKSLFDSSSPLRRKARFRDLNARRTGKSALIDKL
jgi:hypothetical protein